MSITEANQVRLLNTHALLKRKTSTIFFFFLSFSVYTSSIGTITGVIWYLYYLYDSKLSAEISMTVKKTWICLNVTLCHLLELKQCLSLLFINSLRKFKSNNDSVDLHFIPHSSSGHGFSNAKEKGSQYLRFLRTWGFWSQIWKRNICTLS